MLNMKLARIKKEMSQAKLAELIEVHVKVISRYETGVNYPTVATLLKLSEVLEVSVDHLLGVEKEK